jgi:two-component system, OmpR family, phosphate regulon sensor histidine kinase PhoR
VTRRIFFKLFVFFLLVIAAATVTLDLTIRTAWEQSLYSTIERNLSQKTLMFANRVRTAAAGDYPAVAREAAGAADARATIIDAQGHVLADSEANPSDMENHATRPEFIAALHGRWARTRGPVTPWELISCMWRRRSRMAR